MADVSADSPEMLVRATKLCEGVPPNLRARAFELAVNVLWMEAKLAEARAAIGKSSVAIPYDNGGGQRGIRKNPAFDGYNALMANYTKALKQLCEMLGEQEPEDDEDAIDEIMSRRDTGADRAGRARRRRV